MQRLLRCKLPEKNCLSAQSLGISYILHDRVQSPSRENIWGPGSIDTTLPVCMSKLRIYFQDNYISRRFVELHKTRSSSSTVSRHQINNLILPSFSTSSIRLVTQKNKTNMREIFEKCRLKFLNLLPICYFYVKRNL